MKNEVLKYYLKNRPLFLALIRSCEIDFYTRHSKLKGGVLDFGSGDGFFLHTLKKFAPMIFNTNEILGLDVNKKSNGEASKYKLYTDLEIYNGIKVPFSNNFFDTIISNCVFEHLENLKVNLKELYRVLKPGGTLYTTVMTKKWDDYVLLPKKFWRKKQKHLNLFTYKQWYNLFEKTGFRVVKKEGYLNKIQSRIIEIFHFISLPYLASYKLLNNWSFPGPLYNLAIPTRQLSKIYSKKPSLGESSAIFFKLQKL